MRDEFQILFFSKSLPGKCFAMEPPPPPPPPPPFVLPKSGDLSGEKLGLLDGDSRNLRDLFLGASNLLSRLKYDCSDLDHRLLHLRQDLMKHVVSWISRSFSAKSSLQNLTAKLENLGVGRTRPQMNWELQQLVEELCRIQSIRKYVVTALKLETLVGDLEDSVFHPISTHKGSMLQVKLLNPRVSADFVLKQERFNNAIKVMNSIEEILVEVTRYHSQWCHLVESVDNRVDKSLSILRPQIIAEHRALLTSLGWPPKLAISKVEHGEVSSIPNPLLLMQGDKKESYSQSFLLLCALQHFQTQKDKRKKLKMSKQKGVGLWALDELVGPIASRMEYHFLKWAEQPEFTFALVYKVTRDFAGGVDDVLQPLIDKARLVSCSAKETWVSAMIQMLSSFLEKSVFPGLVERFKEKHMKSEVISTWLHLVDLMVAFDKRMRSLVGADTAIFRELEVFSQDISVMALFCKKPEWLKAWGKIELKDAYRKLKEEIKDDKAWSVSDNERTKVGLESNTQASKYALSTREEYEAPFVAEFVLSMTWKLIDRSLSLPSIQPRAYFVRTTATKFLWYFIKILFLQFKKTELSYDSLDEDALIEVCGPINAARYIESKLQEWSDDLDFVEMRVAETSTKVDSQPECSNQSCFFEDEVKGLVEMETNWLMEIITVLLLQFENLSGDYFHKELFLEENLITGSSDVTVSLGFVEALDSLRRQLRVLELNLNPKDFFDLWRSLAEGLDHYISRKIFSAKTVSPRKWIDRLGGDAGALLVVFQPYCVRPDAFFPCAREILKVVGMSEEERKRMRGDLRKESSPNGKNCLSSFGITHLSVQQVEQILRC